MLEPERRQFDLRNFRRDPSLRNHPISPDISNESSNRFTRRRRTLGALVCGSSVSGAYLLTHPNLEPDTVISAGISGVIAGAVALLFMCKGRS